jgi:hypothetical protein
MSKRKGKGRENAAGDDRAPRQGNSVSPRPVIPDRPPMSGAKRRWPLTLALIVLVSWIAWLIFLAFHTTRWGR